MAIPGKDKDFPQTLVEGVRWKYFFTIIWAQLNVCTVTAPGKANANLSGAM